MTRLISFDVDGTIADTRELSARAYAEVGVTVPDEAYGLRWQEWLPKLLGTWEGAELVNRAKAQVYSTLLERADLRALVLPPGRVAYAHLARGHGPVRYLTAGSVETATILLRRLGILGHVRGNLTLEARTRELAGRPANSAYIDDNADTVRHLVRHCPHLNLIHYTNQSYEQLLEALWNPSTR